MFVLDVQHCALVPLGLLSRAAKVRVSHALLPSLPTSIGALPAVAV